MKFTRDLVLQGGILLILVEAVTSISISCGPDSFFRALQWNCDVCGDNFLLGSSPIVCAPANATLT
ncbi:uncharacterized protein K489DRAFT_381854 [Dissoconium aciculare CBS 342.82]|uniref:Uncharacterized protein n=1 Tax=Dissoconium aciculare CBS 342.82 TaxID=1314786 RepID=A0A6J3M1F2_9PEZI|nr:uncharacterized protein K489DRAFT_381854 [Dissoconium aciculare CBS 342.82]KAF1821851.1 hypothetical protein K489DRAFT_381854 [Dissoconium aciculare CBS 342.82]